VIVHLYDDQMPEGLDDMLWVRFVELHAARAQLDLLVREQMAKVGCLKTAVLIAAICCLDPFAC
jgi:hypothetical protein